jgi:hypothetical protein
MDKKCFTSPLEGSQACCCSKEDRPKKKRASLAEIAVRTRFSRQTGITNLEYEKIGILV